MNYPGFDKDTLKLCDCAKCGKDLLGLSMALWYDQLTPEQQAQLPEFTAARVNGRPYCKQCLNPIFQDDK